MLSTERTILVTGAGGPAGRSAVDQLTRRGLRVIATDIRQLPSSAARFVIGPRADSPSYLPFLQEMSERHELDLLIPTVQEELPALAVASTVLDCAVTIGASTAVALCHDKLLTMRYLARHGVPVPVTDVATRAPSGLPVVIKPRVSRGSRGVSIIDRPGRMPDVDDGLILQELAPGPEYCPQVHRTADGSRTTVVMLKKSSLREGHISHREQVTRLPLDAEPDVARLAVEVAEALDLHGPMDMDVRRSRYGAPLVLEVNARLGAHSHHAPEILDGVLAEAHAVSAHVAAVR